MPYIDSLDNPIAWDEMTVFTLADVTIRIARIHELAGRGQKLQRTTHDLLETKTNEQFGAELSQAKNELEIIRAGGQRLRRLHATQ